MLKRIWCFIWGHDATHPQAQTAYTSRQTFQMYKRTLFICPRCGCAYVREDKKR